MPYVNCPKCKEIWNFKPSQRQLALTPSMVIDMYEGTAKGEVFEVICDDCEEEWRIDALRPIERKR